MHQPFYTAVEALFPRFDQAKLPSAYIRFRHYSDLTFPKVVSGEWTWDYMRFYRLNETLMDYGHQAITESVAKDFQQIYEVALEKIALHPAIIQSIEYLADKGIKLGIITNGPTKHQLKKIKNLGVNRWINNRIVVSQEVGYSKPEIEIFQIAEKRFGFKPEETLYVGDNYENDIVGASSADWQSIWLNHRSKQLDDKITPRYTYYIDSFEQMLPMLKKALN
jgi:putative hydrolase of the HAD superfamily